MERYARVFRPTEIKMMLAAFANMETVHIAAYALLLETLGMPDSEFTAFMDYSAMRDKHDYLQGFGVETEADTLRTLAMFGGFTEGLQLFASFAILLNFPRHNKMRGMGQVVGWSVRDETLHCEGIIRLFHTFAQETGALSPAVKDDIVECARTVVTLEDRFVDLAFEMGPVQAADETVAGSSRAGVTRGPSATGARPVLKRGVMRYFTSLVSANWPTGGLPSTASINTIRVYSRCTLPSSAC
jgi:ribonucleoside-diphosphate reductase beta chain